MQKWLWQASARGVCTLCNDTVAGPGYVQYSKHNGSEKAVRLICFHCNREDLNHWYAERRGSQQRNTSVVEPPPQPVPVFQTEVRVSQPTSPTVPLTGIGETIHKKVIRDPMTGLISGVVETRFSSADYRKHKAQHRTLEEEEAALNSYAKWKRARNRKGRGRR